MKEVTPHKTQLYHESKYIWNAYYLIDLFYHPPIPLLGISYCRWLSELHGKNLSGTHKQQKTGRAEWRGDSKGTTKVNCSLFFFWEGGGRGGYGVQISCRLLMLTPVSKSASVWLFLVSSCSYDYVQKHLDSNRFLRNIVLYCNRF